MNIVFARILLVVFIVLVEMDTLVMVRKKVVALQRILSFLSSSSH